MSAHFEPKPGHWYINRSGKLIKVRLAAYNVSGLYAVSIQYLEGRVQLLTARDWYRLDLVVPRKASKRVAWGTDNTS